MFFYFIDYMYTRNQNQCQAGVHKLVTMFKKFVLLKFNITVLPLLLPCSTKFNLQVVNLFFFAIYTKNFLKNQPKKMKTRTKANKQMPKKFTPPKCWYKKRKQLQ